MARAEVSYVPPRRLLSFVVLAFVAGCGLSAYEAKMAEEQERLRWVDEENKLLEGPLRWPEKKDTDKDAKAVLPSEVFVRPPKGIAVTPDERPTGGHLYRYRATVNNPAFPEVFLAVTKEPSATFQQDVLQSLNGAGATKSSKEIKRPGREPLRFDMYREPLTSLSFFFYRADPYQVALVYRTGEGPNTAQMIDYSLGSLVVGSAAGRQHRAFQGQTTPTGSGSRGAR